MHSPADSAAENRVTPRDMLLDELVYRKVRVRARDVVFVKGVIEASEGLAAVFAESGGDLTIATCPGQEEKLDEILRDLAEDAGALLD